MSEQVTTEVNTDPIQQGVEHGPRPHEVTFGAKFAGDRWAAEQALESGHITPEAHEQLEEERIQAYYKRTTEQEPVKPKEQVVAEYLEDYPDAVVDSGKAEVMAYAGKGHRELSVKLAKAAEEASTSFRGKVHRDSLDDQAKARLQYSLGDSREFDPTDVMADAEKSAIEADDREEEAGRTYKEISSRAKAVKIGALLPPYSAETEQPETTTAEQTEAHSSDEHEN